VKSLGIFENGGFFSVLVFRPLVKGVFGLPSVEFLENAGLGFRVDGRKRRLPKTMM